MVVLLEGGYNLTSTALSVEAVLRVMLGESPAPLPGQCRPSPAGMVVIKSAIMAQAPFWACMAVLHSVGFEGGADQGEEEEEVVDVHEPLPPRRRVPVAAPPAPPAEPGLGLPLSPPREELPAAGGVVEEEPRRRLPEEGGGGGGEERRSPLPAAAAGKRPLSPGSIKAQLRQAKRQRVAGAVQVLVVQLFMWMSIV